ncbi:MAG TPA: hypothetical protein VG603_15135 [Chitinophagales bacterium]|nr:hypothetical protein [Chitinophagales bacterium]
MFSLIIYILTVAVGFMMGFVYTQSTTSAGFLKPNPQRTLKLFLWFFAASVAITFTLSFFATYELHAGNAVLDSSMKFHNLKSIMLFVVNISLFALVVIANAYSLARKKLAIIPYLLIAAFYCLFILKDAYYMSDYFILWEKSLKLFKGELPDFHSTGWMKCWLGASVILFNALMVWWGMRQKQTSQP